MTEPQILRPYNRQEVWSVAEAASWAGRSKRTIRSWCLLYDIGRKINGQWYVSKVALLMRLEGNRGALVAYLAGDRSSELVTVYFARCGVPLPREFSSEKNDYRNQSNPNV